MDAFTEIKKSLLTTIRNVADKRIKKFAPDVTKQGRVTVVEGNGLYTVAINGQEYSGLICACNIALAVNDAVWVTVPQNVWMHKFIAGRR